MNRIVAGAAWIAALAFSTGVSAVAPPNITNEELKLAPPYCPDTNTFGYGGAQYNQSPNAPKWVAIMGPTFWAMHHYCWAIINLSRIQRPGTSEMVKRSVRLEALGDLNFVLEHGEQTSVVMPEIFTKIGEVQLALGNLREANDAYAQARSLRPDYWPAYYQWADYLQRTGRKNEARQLVEEGLSHAPGNKSLELLLTAIGGNPGTVKPQKKGVETAN
jgi:tetratricopeptide (TPR) repeat protein